MKNTQNNPPQNAQDDDEASSLELCAPKDVFLDRWEVVSNLYSFIRLSNQGCFLFYHRSPNSEAEVLVKYFWRWTKRKRESVR